MQEARRMRGSRSEPQERVISGRMHRRTKHRISVKNWPQRSAPAPREGVAAKRAAWIGSQGDLLDGQSIQQLKSVEGIRTAGWPEEASMENDMEAAAIVQAQECGRQRRIEHERDGDSPVSRLRPLRGSVQKIVGSTTGGKKKLNQQHQRRRWGACARRG